MALPVEIVTLVFDTQRVFTSIELLVVGEPSVLAHSSWLHVPETLRGQPVHVVINVARDMVQGIGHAQQVPVRIVSKLAEAIQRVGDARDRCGWSRQVS